LESPTWRANPDWGAKLGYGRDRLAEANRAGIEMMRKIRAAQPTRKSPLVISGCIGPRGDGYAPGVPMRADDAQDYHAWQIGVLQDAGADLISAFTLTNIGEAVGVACAAKATGIACVISFTLETDGRLTTGESLAQAIETVDRATCRAPAYYMINCAHPDHFRHVLDEDADWMQRVRGIRANASRKSHAELDNSTELDAGHPQQLASNTRRCSAASRRSMFWADAAAPTNVMWHASRRRAAAHGLAMSPRRQLRRLECRLPADNRGAADLGAPLIRESLLAFRHGEHRSFGFAKRRVFSQHLILRHIAGLRFHRHALFG
jgi:S-methylmethionine-dependent homocysteine/selenocysteine methylase